MLVRGRGPLESGGGWRVCAIFYGLVTTARRISEWLYVRWGDVSEDSNGGLFFTYRAKGGRMRRQVIPDVLRLVIDRYLTEAQMQASGKLVDAAWEYRRIDDCGHWIPLQRPDAVASVALDWFGRHPPATAGG